MGGAADAGLLDVGDGHRVRWQVSGDPDGAPALVLHGGPGSGAGPGWRRLLDPAAHRVVLLDQRGCGRSTPHAGDRHVDLSAQTTQHLVADVERLREHLGVESWLLLGGSWGTTLALAYAQAHPERVSAAVLFSVTTTTRREVEHVTRGLRTHLPREWERFAAGVPPDERDGDLATAYARLLHHPDPAVHEPAALAWCRWEDAHVDPVGARAAGDGWADQRYADPRFRLAFARLVTHYWSHAAFLPDGQLLRGVADLGHVPAVLLHGRDDLGSPLAVAEQLAATWPGARLEVVDDAGHGAGPAMTRAVVAATDRLREVLRHRR